MAYFIPTEDPDFKIPDWNEEELRERKRNLFKCNPIPIGQPSEPRYKVGDLVMIDGGMHIITKVIERHAKNGKSKGAWYYQVGKNDFVTEKKMAPVNDEILKSFNLRRL